MDRRDVVLGAVAGTVALCASLTPVPAQVVLDPGCQCHHCKALREAVGVLSQRIGLVEEHVLHQLARIEEFLGMPEETVLHRPENS